MVSAWSSVLLALSISPLASFAQKSSGTATAKEAATTVHSAAPKLTEPCAIISHGITSYASAYPSATQGLIIPASLAWECQLSAPINVDDAVNLLDGLVAFFQFESDLAYQKNPPSGYLLAGVDLIGGLEKLKTQVKAGAYKSEVLFESDLAGLLGETHNGHLQFLTDGLGVFNHQRNLGALVSISSDGIELPQVYLTRDAYHLYLNGTPAQPVTAINGDDVVQWLTNYALNTTFRDQDPDTLYNVVMYEVANADTTGGYFTSPFPNFYIGAETNITYANGTTKSSMNTAQTNLDFTGVHDGKSYYNKFCNANNKQQSSGGGSKVKRDGVDAALLNRDIESRRTKQIPYPRSQYPPAVVEASDGSFAGYFLNGTGFENVAVLSILSVTEDVPLNAQKMVKEFIRLCQANGRDHLIIDQQSNGGGLIMLGYDTFKQLFPSIAPFLASSFRATPEYDIIGKAGTKLADQTVKNSPHNYTAYNQAGVFGFTDGDGFNNLYGVPFETWDQYFGPEQRYGDNFTHAIRWRLNDTDFDQHWGVKGFELSNADNPDIPNPFADYLLLTDGQCGSTCTLISHLLKWQGKVKSITLGGRPQLGPMQAVGGVKGKNVIGLPSILQIVYELYSGANKHQQTLMNQTYLKPIIDQGLYMINRLQNPAQADGQASLNLQNSLAQYDPDFTPQQFVYEAADCRLWWTLPMIFDITQVWSTVAAQGWGLNGTTVFSGCVQGSVGDPSSLTGNPQLYAGGVPSNVTSYFADPGVPVPQGVSILSAAGASATSAAATETSGVSAVAATSATATATTAASAAPTAPGFPGGAGGPPRVKRWEA